MAIIIAFDCYLISTNDRNERDTSAVGTFITLSWSLFGINKIKINIFNLSIFFSVAFGTERIGFKFDGSYQVNLIFWIKLGQFLCWLFFSRSLVDFDWITYYLISSQVQFESDRISLFFFKKSIQIEFKFIDGTNQFLKSDRVFFP
jgi:hypothetical protein